MPDLRKFFIGVGAIIASTQIPGGGFFARFATTALFSTGSGLVVEGLSPDAEVPRPSDTAGHLIQSADTLNHIALLYGTSRLAGRVVFLDSRNTSPDERRGTDGSNARLDIAVVYCLGNRTPQPGEPGLAAMSGPISGFGGVFVSPEEAGIQAFGDTFFDDRLVYTARKIIVLRDFIQGSLRFSTSDLIDPLHEFYGRLSQEADTYLIAPNGPDDPLEDQWQWAHDESEWSEDHRLAGCAGMVFGLRWDERALATIPNITSVMRGRKVRLLTPLRGNLSWEWSVNPAECLYDYLLDEKSGGAQPLRLINVPTWRAAALRLAEFVPNLDGESAPRSTLNGPIDTGRSVQSNLGDMLSTFGGVMDWSMGEWHLRYHKPEALPVMDLNESNIIGDWSWHTLPIEDQANLMIANYPEPTAFASALGEALEAEIEDASGDPDLLFSGGTSALREEMEQVQFPIAEQVPNPYALEDGGIEVPREITLPLTRNRSEAQRRCAEELLQSRAPLVVNVTGNESCLRLALLDRVTITHERPGWVGKKFWVQKLGINTVPDTTVSLVLREEAPGFAPPPAIPQLILKGEPFEIIRVPANETRPPRAWITLPFGREGDVCLAVVDVPSGEITYIPDPDFPGTFGNMSYWCACYVSWLNEVWVANNLGGTARIYVFNATTMDHKRSLIYDDPDDLGEISGTILDIEAYSPRARVVVGASDGVYFIDTDDDTVIEEKLTSSKTIWLPSAGAFANDVRALVPKSDSEWAAISLRDRVWYFDPNQRNEHLDPLRLDGPLFAIISPDTGDWINQGEVIGDDYYHVWAALGDLRTWEKGLAQTSGTYRGIVEEPGSFNFVRRASTFDQGDLLALSRGTGTGSTPGATGALVMHRPGGGNVAYPLDFHPGRTAYFPEVNWMAVTSFWRSVTFGGKARVCQFVPIGEVPLDAPPGTPPFEPEEPEFEDPDAPPEPGPDDNVADPNAPNVQPTITADDFCVDTMQQSSPGVFSGAVEAGWKVTLVDADFPAGTPNVDFDPNQHPHEVVGWLTTDDPIQDPPRFVVAVPVPVEGQSYQRTVFDVRGTFTGERPQCGGPSDEPDAVYEIFMRRHVQGFLPGPLSNGVVVTIPHPGPEGDAGLPPDDDVGEPTPSTSTARCVSTVTGETNNRSGTVRVFGEVRFRRADDFPIEVYEMALDDDPLVDDPIKVWRPSTINGVAKVVTDDVFKVDFQRLPDSEVPTCGKTHPTEPNVIRDYYGRHRTADGPADFSTRIRLTYRYPGPAGEQAPSGGGFAPVLDIAPTFSCDVASSWAGNVPKSVRTLMRLSVGYLPPDTTNPFSIYPIYMYVMDPGDHPDTDTPALQAVENSPVSPAPYKKVQLSSYSVAEVWMGVKLYTADFDPPPACNAGPTLYTFDLFFRHESKSGLGNSDWLGPVSVSFRLAADPP